MSEDDKHLSKFLIDILGPAAKEIKELLGDRARYWRWKNLLSIREKFNTKCQEQGINPEKSENKLALSIGLPLLEVASYQNDDFLQDRWANLLVDSVKSDPQEYNIDITFVRMLEQFSRLDCEVLEYVVENGIEEGHVDDTPMVLHPLLESDIRQAFPDSLVHIALEKLVSLGCVARSIRLPMTPTEGEGGGHNSLMEDIVPTLMGINLYASSSGKSPRWHVSSG